MAVHGGMSAEQLSDSQLLEIAAGALQNALPPPSEPNCE